MNEMQIVLNFSEKEKEKVLEELKKYEKGDTQTEFEEYRAKKQECTITLYTSGKLVIQGENCEKVKEELMKALDLEDELILGIDETGRGEDYGTLVVAGVLGYTNSLRELRDSKKTSNIEEKKEIVEKNALETYSVEFTAKEIDTLRETGYNLNEIQSLAVNRIIRHFKNRKEKFKTIVDGEKLKGVEAEFLVKGDDKVVQIGAASVVAKYLREKSKDKEKRKTWKTQNS